MGRAVSSTRRSEAFISSRKEPREGKRLPGEGLVAVRMASRSGEGASGISTEMSMPFCSRRRTRRSAAEEAGACPLRTKAARAPRENWSTAARLAFRLFQRPSGAS